MMNRLKNYAKNCSIHGPRFLVDEERSLLERKGYMILFAFYLFGTVYGVYFLYQSFKYNSISFVTETTYLNWNTTFPAVTVCEMTNSDFSFSDKESVEVNEMVQEFISDIILFTGSCYSCSKQCEECKRLNFTRLVRRYRKDCSAMLTKCKWNNKKFNCCDKFLPIETEYGVCYSLNSLHTSKSPGSDVVLKSNRKSGPGELEIEAKDDIRLYFHAPEDVPYTNSDPNLRKDIVLGESYNISFTVTEISNEDAVKYLPFEKRNCRFPNELPPSLLVHDYYSYSTCIVQCHADAHFEFCNCTHHLMPFFNKQGYCDISGLDCLTQKSEILNRLRSKGFNRLGLECDCIPSCEEPEYNIVLITKGATPGLSKIKLKMHALPSTRFKRLVVRTTLDFIVTIGGSIGLFTAASVLSFVELVYWMFI